jgi:hypothetical protein
MEVVSIDVVDQLLQVDSEEFIESFHFIEQYLSDMLWQQVFLVNNFVPENLVMHQLLDWL